ncbi:MAG: tetratricopeptide repeat protein [Spirochaetaceae bacterium]|nr:tetratricopeptide repeat protein [Spirochaetaceae bacterium]
MKNLLKGIQLYRKKNYQDAFAFFLEYEPDSDVESIECIYYLGLCCVCLHRYEEAIEFLEQIVTTAENPQRINQCRLALAVVYSLTERNEMAKFEIDTLLENGYKPAVVYGILAYQFWSKGDTIGAIQYYEKALAIDKENPTALNGLGYVLATENKDLTKSLMLCKKALDMQPDSPAFLDSMGWVYYKLGLLEEAHNFLKRAKDLNTQNHEEINEHYRLIQSAIHSSKDITRITKRETE